MTILGIGPLLALIAAVCTAILLVLNQLLGVSIHLPLEIQGLLRALGIGLCIIGAYFWASSAVLIRRNFPSHRLVTSGVFHLSRNPMYAAFIVFIVPGIAFLCNDLMILGIALAVFVAFKALIRKEEEFLRREFGAEFETYTLKVPQLIPFVKP